MARARDILIRFLGDERDLVRSGKKVNSAVGDVTKVFNGFKTLAGGAVIGAVAGVVRAWGEMADAARQDAKSVDTLHAAIKQNTTATEGQILANDKWIDSMQIATLTADTDLRQAMQSLVSTGATVEESQRIIAVAIDVAAARGLEFTTVINAMIKAQNGQVTGLSRLGVATKDASGQALTLNEILIELERTMGGAAAEAANTLAGGAERARLIMEEASETAGAAASGPFSKLGDIWAVLNELVKTGSAELSTVNEEYNDLIRRGIDPFIDKQASAIEILRESLKVTDISAETFATLRAMLGFTAADASALSATLKENGEELGFNEEQVRALVAAMAPDPIDSWHNALRMGVGDRKAFIDDTEAATEATWRYTDAQLAAADPTFAVAQAANAADEAYKNYADAVGESGQDSEEAEEAALRLGEAQLRLEAAAAKFADEGGQAGIDAIVTMLRQGGVMEDTINRIITAIGKLNRTPVTNRFAHQAGSVGRFDTGGVVPGPRGQPQLAVVEGGETILPTHKPGFKIPRYDKGTLSRDDKLGIIRREGGGFIAPGSTRSMGIAPARAAAEEYWAQQRSGLGREAARRRAKFARRGSINMNVSGFADSVEAVRHANEIDRHLDRLERQRAR